MAEHHCRVVQERPPQLGGTTELASGLMRDGDDVVHPTLHMPTERDVDMPLGQLQQHVADITENTGWDTTIIWDD
jgi:hypothetical protein